jgi:DNA polymerase-3 subunit epsilon/ATP-dependent DNA helicase DinG
LSGKGIPVLAQGVDGTPQQLIARFQENPKAVLLGTASFWEGVDIANNAMKVLVVARLPFNVPTEPVFAARSGLYDSPFMQYAVPQAVLKFRQGFGRLIRNKDDHGAIVVLDSRITSKPYGKAFLDSVPPATTLRAPLAEIMSGVRDWLREPEEPNPQSAMELE